MKNKKGFTLIELLVAITIIGIIMLMVLPAITNLQRENQEKKFNDYERAVLEAAKAYEDQYEEDLFGRYSEGCAYIDYKSLVEKKLLNTTKISGYECNYDTNGIIIRKVNGKSFYEVYLDCIKKDETKKLTGNSNYNTIKMEQCDIGEDKEPPKLEIKCDGETNENPNYVTGIEGDDTHLYYRGVKRGDNDPVLPELTVKASDKNSGLEKNQYISYEWKIYTDDKDQDIKKPNSTEKNKTIFNTKDGAGSTAEKKVRIIEALKQNNATGIARIDLYGDNIVDRAGNKREGVKKDCTYYYDNTPPEMEIRITGNNSGREYSTTTGQWINEPITTTVTVTDKTKDNTNDIYSGIRMESFENSNIKDATLSEKDGNATHTYTLIDENRKEDDTYTVCDKVGNCVSQTVLIRVDTINPTCKSRDGDSNWRNRNITINGDCVDQGDPAHYSGCRRDEYSKEYSAEQSITNATAGEACDNAGNCVICSEDQQVHIDKTLPNCTTNGESTDWATSRTIKYNCEDPISGGVRSNCTQTTFETITYSSTTKTTSKTWNIKDNAGNTRTCTKNNVNVYMDNTVPNCNVTVSNENIAGQQVEINGTCTESDSEIGKVEWNIKFDNGAGFNEANGNSFVYPNPYSYITHSTRAGSYQLICTNKAGLTCTKTVNIKESTCNKCPETCCPHGLHRSGDLCCAAMSFYCLGLQTCYTGRCTDAQYCGYHKG